ncbi:MAG: sigma-70 family RNA polymerase sigma factor [Armatimonadota bacterium]|jgi:RNA polymerase sigma-B factor|nr:sigma-70 family RNA polymerase sigma factor [Acidobacteriota bacterium]
MTMSPEEARWLSALQQSARDTERAEALSELVARYGHTVSVVLARVLPDSTRSPRLRALGELVLCEIALALPPEGTLDLPTAIRQWVRRKLEKVLFRQIQSDDEESIEAAQAELVFLYDGLALSLAHRFSERGEPVEDLQQVARLGLLRALRRFDAERGVRFATYATQSVVGELKKHFRDRGWGVHVPRSLQEVNLAARRASDTLTQQLGRSPTVDEIAGSIGQSPEMTLEALELGQQAYELLSLDEAAGDDEEGTVMGDFIASGAGATSDFRDLAEAETILDALPTRLRKIVRWRHLEGLSQTEIAARLEISQMHVSRLYRRAISMIHASLADDESSGGRTPQ